MPLPSLPVTFPDISTAWRRIAETINQLIKYQVAYPRTAAEIAAGVTPVNFGYAPGDVRRYGTNTTPGTTDMTAAIANSFLVSASHPTIFQAETYKTDKQTIPANGRVFMPPGCTLKDSGNLGTNDRTLTLSDGVNITGWGATLDGNTSAYGTHSEQRHGIYMPDVNGVSILGLTSKNCDGDGFYVGTAGTTYSQNVTMIDCIADSNRRNGMSIVSVDTMVVIGGRFSNSTGTNPKAGIDMEPNAATNRLARIRMVDVKTSGNAGAGISGVFGAIDGTSEPISIEIIGHLDNGSGAAAEVSNGASAAHGLIRWTSPQWINSGANSFNATNHGANGIRVEINDPYILDTNTTGQTSTNLGAAFAILYTSGTDTAGGIHVRNPHIESSGTDKPTTVLHANNGVTAGLVDDCSFIDPKAAIWTATTGPFDVAGKVFVSDRERLFTKALTASATLSQISLWTELTNAGATGTITLDLPDLPEDGTEWTFRVEAAQKITLRVNNVDSSLLLYPGALGSIASSQIGASIAVRRDSTAGGYTITRMVGSWLPDLLVGLANFASDSAAATGGIPVNGLYRNGSAVQVRVS